MKALLLLPEDSVEEKFCEIRLSFSYLVVNVDIIIAVATAALSDSAWP